MANCRHAHYPFGLAVNGEMLYWTDLNTQGVHYMNITTKKSGVVYSGHKHLLGVVMVTAKQQSKGMAMYNLIITRIHYSFVTYATQRKSEGGPRVKSFIVAGSLESALYSILTLYFHFGRGGDTVF